MKLQRTGIVMIEIASAPPRRISRPLAELQEAQVGTGRD